MNRKLILWSALLLIAVSFTSCFNCVSGDGPITITERDEGDFEAILLSSSFEVVLVPSDQCFVSIEAQENLHDYILTENENGRLKVHSEECISYSDPVIITVGVRDLRAVKISGSGDIRGEGLFNTDELDVTISGSGDVTLDVSAENVNTSINGSGDIKISGFCDRLEAGIAGSGDVSAQNLIADDVKTWIAGSGDVRVHAQKSIDATINGSGDITYSGDASDIQTRVNGSGNIHRSE